jgi:hypothetical protein
MIFVTFISIHFVIICVVLLWHTYETHAVLSLKFECDMKKHKLNYPTHDLELAVVMHALKI